MHPIINFSDLWGNLVKNLFLDFIENCSLMKHFILKIIVQILYYEILNTHLVLNINRSITHLKSDLF